jgi:hypothetical protein
MAVLSRDCAPKILKHQQCFLQADAPAARLRVRLESNGPDANREGRQAMKAERQKEATGARRHAGRLILKPVKQLFGLIFRTILTSLVFYAVVGVSLHALGYPVPRISDVGRYLAGLSELAKILS